MKKILMAVDETKGSRSVLSVYRTMVQEPETVVLIHVQPSAVRSMTPAMPVDPELRSSWCEEVLDERSERIIRFYEQEIEKDGPVRIKTLVREGVPSEEILRAAREESVDLIIMGFTGKQLFNRFAAGSTVKQVERGATTPVLVATKSRCEKSNKCRWKERETYAA
jgi:nucleotide-binding universal stress UspA family protein